MSSRIYLIQGDESLVAMREERYDTEDLLQGLLAHYPDLLAGDQIDTSEPRQWLLVTREMGIPDEEAGLDRWSVDHLFVDQDAIPTLIEVKRSTDTRLRREVVGQMLDYAANAMAYWPAETLRLRFESQAELAGRSPDEMLADTFGPEVVADAFWERVSTNLKAGRLRLVFVADVIPAELRRVIEFLNASMPSVDVIGIEVKQFMGQGLRALVPHVVTQTTAPQKTTTRSERIQWNEDLFRDALRANHGDQAVAVVDTILRWAEAQQVRVQWKPTRAWGVCYLTVGDGDIWRVPTPIGLWTYGKVSIEFGGLMNYPPFSQYDLRLDLLQRLNAIPGVKIGEDRITKYPSIPMKTLADPPVTRQFLDVLEWVIGQLREPSMPND